MISIIVPVYNVESYIAKCIDSILLQTYKDIEVVLIDDGSTDNSGAICDRYALSDNRVRVFHSENNGLSAARNLGISESKGDYIGFVDSDDWIEPNMYELMLNKIQESAADICVCGLSYEYRTKTRNSPCLEAEYNNMEAINALICGDLRNCVMNKLWTRKSVQDLNFPVGCVFEDIYTVYRVFMNVNSVSTVPQVLYRYRQRKSGIARAYSMKSLIDYWNAIRERYENLKSFTDFETSKRLRRQCASAIARTWRWFYGIPKTEQNHEYLRSLNRFMIQNFSLFGDSDWPFALRFYAFLAHSDSKISLALAYLINYLFWELRYSRSFWI